MFAFFADEEAGGVGQPLAGRPPPRAVRRARPRRSARSAGSSRATATGDRRAYLLQTAEKGIAWLRLRATGRAGHGSMINADNAVTRLAAGGRPDRRARVAARVHRRRCAQFLEGSSELTGVELDADDDPDALLGRLGGVARLRRRHPAHTANPTMLEAGYKANVIPQSAEAVRRLPVPARPRGRVLWRRSRELAGTASRSSRAPRQSPLEAPFDGDLVDAMKAALLAEDPAPPCCRTCCPAAPTTRRSTGSASAATGSRRCGCRPTWTSRAMFHGVDERVPMDALRFGTRVLRPLPRDLLSASGVTRCAGP